MIYQRNNPVWFFVKSMAVMAVVLLPFFYMGKSLLAGQFVNSWTVYIVDTVFSPAAWVFNVVCSSMSYCIYSEYSGASVMIPVYILSVILYGYFISLIWRWISVPKTHYRRKQSEFDEHDGFF